MDCTEPCSTSTLTSLDDFCLTQVIKALGQGLSGVSRVNKRFHRLARRRIRRLFLQGEDGLVLSGLPDAARYREVFELWYNITCTPQSLPAATAAILFAAQHCPELSELRLALRWASMPTTAAAAAAGGMEVDGQQESSEARLLRRWWNSYMMYPCNLATQLAAAQQLNNVHRLCLRMGTGMSSALHFLALMPRLTWLQLTVLEGARCWLELDDLRALKQLQLGWLQIEGVSLMEGVPWDEAGEGCPLPRDISFWRLARVKGMLRWTNALWHSPHQELVHLEYSEEQYMEDHPTLLLPQQYNSMAYTRVLVLARPPAKPPITWQAVPDRLSAALTAAVLPPRALRHMRGLEKVRMECWWMAACSPRCWLALASAPRLNSLAGLVAMVPPPRRVLLARLKWLRGVVGWGGAGLAPLLQSCPGLRGLEVVVEMPCRSLDPEMFHPDLCVQLHQHLQQMYAAGAQGQQQQEGEQEEQEDEEMEEEEEQQQQQNQLAALLAAVQQEHPEEAGMIQLLQLQLQLQQEGQQQQQQQQQQQVEDGVAQQQQQQPPAVVVAAQGEQPVVAEPLEQPAVQPPLPAQEQGEGGDGAGQEAAGPDEEEVNPELEQPAHPPRARDPNWISPGVKGRCLRYLDLTYQVVPQHHAAASASLVQLPGLLPRVEVFDLVVPPPLVPALLLAVPRLTCVTVLGLVVGLAADSSKGEPESDTVTSAAQLAAALMPLRELRELYLEGWQGLCPQQLAAQVVGVGPAQLAAPALKLRSVLYRRCGTQQPAAAAAAAAAGQGQGGYPLPTAVGWPSGQQQQQGADVLPAWLEISAAQHNPRPRVWRPQNTPLFDQPGVEEGWAGEAVPPDLEEGRHDRFW